MITTELWAATFTTENGFRIVRGPKRQKVYCTNGYFISGRDIDGINTVYLDPENLWEITLTPPPALVILKHNLEFEDYKRQVEKIGPLRSFAVYDLRLPKPILFNRETLLVCQNANVDPSEYYSDYQKELEILYDR